MKTTRRQFARSVGAAAVLIAPLTLADSKSPDAEAGLVKAEFGQYLSAEELEKIRKDLAESAPLLETFRAVKLANGDEPDWTFSAMAKR